MGNCIRLGVRTDLLKAEDKFSTIKQFFKDENYDVSDFNPHNSKLCMNQMVKNDDMMSFIIKHKISDLIRDEAGASLLRYNPSVDHIFGLLRAGLEINDRDYLGNTCMHGIASVKLAQRFSEHGAKVTVLNDFGESPLHSIKSKDLVEFFVNRGLDVNLKSKEGNTAVYTAYNSEIASELIKYGANVESSSFFKIK